MDFKCKICNKIYSSYQSRWNHNKKNHNILSSNVNVCHGISQRNVNVCQSNIPDNKPKYECKFCKKNFSSRQGRWSHLKICKEKINKEIEDKIYRQQIEKLTNDLEKLKKKSTKKIITYNTLNNNSNNNTNNNLTNINNIGKEKISDLTIDERKYIMSHGMNSIISLAEHLNFNEKIPWNHNFCVSALNDKHLNTIDNKTHKIIKQRKKEIFDQILVAHIDKLEKINKNINFKDFDNVLTKLKNFIFLKQGKKEYFSQLNMLAYNKRNLIIKTWEELINDDTISPDDITDTFQKRVSEITNSNTNSESYSESESDSDNDSDSESDSGSDSESDFDLFRKKKK